LTCIDGPVFEGETDDALRMFQCRSWKRDFDSCDLRLPQGVLTILPRFTRSAKLVVEAGARLKDLEMVEQFTNRGVNVLCQPGSFLHHGLLDEVLVAKEWVDPSAKFDYLDGMSALFDEIEGHAVPARGGRATSTSGPKSTVRILKAFGGCRFVERDEWKCEGCPHIRGGTYLHPPTDAKCSVNKVLEIKNRGRAIRNGIVNSEAV
jgi:hypothetical protein